MLDKGLMLNKDKTYTFGIDQSTFNSYIGFIQETSIRPH